MSDEFDARVRREVFDFLRRRSELHPSGLVSWPDLKQFRLSDGELLVLIGQPGIWKPRQLELPIAVTTTPPKPGRPAPYEDRIRDDGTIVYRYRGEDPDHRDNVGLREAMARGLFLVYFQGIDPGWYYPHFPVRIIADDPVAKAVTLEIQAGAAIGLTTGEPSAEALRRYAIRAVRQRLHQAQFRSVVMHAYRCRCAVCSLAKAPLLDAAHIIEDAAPEGIAAARNGLSLCKIHHAAYDQNILGIDQDLRIHIARQVLDETDGPMLQHGLKDMHGRPLLVQPSREADRPDPDRLARRFGEFGLAQ